MSVSISATNTGTSTAHPTYSVSVSIPSASPGPDDEVLVWLTWRGPRLSTFPGFSGGGDVTILGDGPAGLSAIATLVSGDDTVDTTGHNNGHYLFRATGSSFVGGSLTVTKGPVSNTPGELWVSITTVVISGPVTLGSPRETIATSGGGSPSVGFGGVSDDVQFFGDHYSGSPVTLSPSNGYTVDSSQVFTSGVAIPHRVGIATAPPTTTAAPLWAGGSTLAYSVAGVAWAASTPPVGGDGGGIYVDGVLHI